MQTWSEPLSRPDSLRITEWSTRLPPYLSLESCVLRWSVLLKLGEQLGGHDLDFVVVPRSGGVHFSLRQDSWDRRPVVTSAPGCLLLWERRKTAECLPVAVSLLGLISLIWLDRLHKMIIRSSTSETLCCQNHSHLQTGWFSFSSPNRQHPSLFCPVDDTLRAILTPMTTMKCYFDDSRSISQTLTFGFRFLEIAMLWPSLLRKEMGDLVLAISAAFSSGLKLWLSEQKTTKRKKRKIKSIKAWEGTLNPLRIMGNYVITASVRSRHFKKHTTEEAALLHHPLSPPGGTVSLNIS